MFDFVDSLEEVIENIQEYQNAVHQPGNLTPTKVSDWYYLPPPTDLAGPSRFIGYKNMTAQRHDTNKVHGGRTQDRLLRKKWFVEVRPGDTYYTEACKAVTRLLAPGKRRRSGAKFYIPSEETSARVEQFHKGVGPRKYGPLDKLLAVEADKAQEEGAFDPTSVKDGRERAAANIVRRQGQPAFRNDLLTAYDRRCAISECDVVMALEAAHITPYRGEATNHPGNGLLLRADLHTLFDQGLIAINTKTMTVMIAHSLRGTCYDYLADKCIRLPSTTALMPSSDALDQHRTWAGL